MEKNCSTSGRQPLTRRQKIRRLGLASILLSFFTLFAFAGPSPSIVRVGAALAVNNPAQASFSGTWTAEVKTDKADGRIQFSFHRSTDRGKMNFSGSDFSLDEFQGLTREQVFAASNTPVKFRLAREAGTLECEGSFRGGRGSGDWRFIQNEGFRSAMGTRGYTLTDDQMFTSAMINLTSSFVDNLKTMGFANLTFEDVIKAQIFKITPEFANELKALGFKDLELEDLVKARIFRVDAEFVRQVQAMGFETGLEQLIKLRIFKVTPEFVGEMKSVNFENLTAEELVKLRIFKVTPGFVNGLKAEGLSPISVEDAVKLKIHHVDEAFVRQVKASGQTDLSVDELVRMRIRGGAK